MSLQSPPVLPLRAESAQATQEPLTEFQQSIADKLSATVLAIAREIFQTVLDSVAITPPQGFIDIHVTPKQAALSGLDERTTKFFNKIMDAVYEEIVKLPLLQGRIPFTTALSMLSIISNDQNITKKLAEGIALPHVKTLLTELDNIKPSIVDELNGA